MLKNNKLIWIGLTILISFLAGFFFSTNEYVVLLIFLPGLLATIISTFFGTDGAESFFVVPEFLVTTFLFWLILPWLLFILSKKSKNDNKKIILFCALATSIWSIGFALNSGLLRFFPLSHTLSLTYYFIVIGLLIFSGILLILKIWEKAE